jgi:para-aminobenzoate synthetase component 1
MKIRNTFSFAIDDIEMFKKCALSFFAREDYLFYLDSNNTADKYSAASCIIAVGCIDKISSTAGKAFDELEIFQEKNQDWMFGFLGYDLKNELEDLKSSHVDHCNFPDLCFVVPELVLQISRDGVEVHSFKSEDEVDTLSEVLKNHQPIIKSEKKPNTARLKAGDSRADYLKKVQQFLDHIQRGDIYEANFCTQFTASKVQLDSLQAFQDLNAISEPPFSAYIKCGDYRVVSASPERYLSKKAGKLISQPIKGTARRSSDLGEDQLLKENLYTDVKERSENVMIVDLVRNDLSKIALKGSVQVDELYGIYTFKQVHHMISTVSATLGNEYSSIDAIKATFPMGSMTGAPKVSAMKIIEQTENFKRGLYSGTVGYFNPQGDFDFNVVIRTVLYNAKTQNLSFAVGSAITIAAQPEKEYEECLLKAKALFEVLAQQRICFKQE